MEVPRATYRLQLHQDFGFDDAAQVADYLRDLGVSHLYLSPVLESSPGSQHGYDATDPTRLDEERGGRRAFERLAERVRELGLGLVLDIVPNHLAVSPRNRWWWEVLENGPSSRWAHVFDVDWESDPGDDGDARVLLPVLGDHYGRALERCEIQIRREEGAFVAIYFDHRFPLSPRTLDDLLRRAAHASSSARLAFLADAFGDLPARSDRGRTAALRRRHRDKEELRRLLVELLRDLPGVRAAVDAEVDAVNLDFARLDHLLQRQSYRLSFWRLAGSQLNYRRFFDVNSLVGVRVETPDVFEEGHEVILGLVRDGPVDGLRVDHPDGLRDPRGYFQRLARAAPGCWIVAEKILEPNERLPVDWGIAGTTGYDFMGCVQGLFVDARAEFALSETYRAFLREEEGEERWLDLVFARKLATCRDLLAGDVSRLVHLLRQVCDARRRFRDFTRSELRRLIEVLVACWPVYRTYVRVPEGGEPGHVAPEDVEILHTALDLARRRDASLDGELLGLFERLMTLREPLGAGREPGEVPLEHELVMRFQQLTGPVMAKGVEDTCFYRYNRFVALNEVGGDPSRFGISPRDFHLEMEFRWKESPASMLGTSTHDTKRSEDVRARLCALTEAPGEWAEAVERWSALNDGRRRSGATAVDRNTEYLFYQTLVGAWPDRVDGALPADWADRVVAYMDKASKEAKARTSWLAPDAAYADSLEAFVRGALADGAFVGDVEGFVARLRPAGWINGLGQTLIKLTSPGVPDIYQGCELWDLSLVDPDNRRPVDFERRRALLAEVERQPSASWSAAGMASGRAKLHVARSTLRLRARHPQLFAAPYAGLELRGDSAEHAVAFRRGRALAVAVTRFSTRIAREGWGETVLELPEAEPRGWVNILTGERVEGPTVRLETLFGRAPVALLVRDAPADAPARDAAELRKAGDGARRPSTGADAPRGDPR